MKKIDAEKYIDWMLPFVKGEVAQANAKLGTIITSNSALLATISVFLGFMHTFGITTRLEAALYVILTLLAVCQVFSLLLAFLGNKPIYKFLSGKSKVEFDESKFFTFKSITIEEYIDKFTHSSNLEKKMLEQIYINGNLADQKYKICKVCLAISLPLLAPLILL